MLAGKTPGAIRLRVFVSGRVQGVGFRMGAVRTAERLGGLKGFVRNCSDGRVEALVEGLPERVHAFCEWLKQGPTGAQVTGFETEAEPAQGGLASFSQASDA